MVIPRSASELLSMQGLINPKVFEPTRASVQGQERTIPQSWQVTAPAHGPRLVIFGGIHGNEWCGVYALRHLLEAFSTGRLVLNAGSLVLAVGNEEAIQKNVRYVGENMNRQFHTSRSPQGSEYERGRVEELKAILRSKVDFFLDLHATTAPSKPYAMVERPFLEKVRPFGFETIVTGWGELGDSSVAGDTQTFAEAHGACGITMENGQLSDPSSTDSAIHVALQFLSRNGVIGIPQSESTASTVYEMTEVRQYERHGFSYAKQFSNLEPLFRGQLVGSDSVQKYFAPTDYDSVIILPGNPVNLKPGDNLFHFGRYLPS